LYTAITVFLLVALAGTASADDIFRKLFGRHRTIDGSGEVVSEKRELDAFDRIESRGPFDLIVQVGPEQSVEVFIDDNLMEVVFTEVHRGTLEIFSDDNVRSHRRSRIEVTVPKLEEVEVSGSGDIDIAGLNSEMFDLRISGSGDIDFQDVQAGEMLIRVSGSGDIRADGTVELLDISINGSGDIDARDLEAKEVEAHISGSGDVRVFASERFDGSTSGSGDITFWGDPEDVSRYVSGSGSIRRR
jgi:hypothetical protein